MTQPLQYQWMRTEDDGVWWHLSPVGKSPWSLERLASLYYDKNNKRWVASYYRPDQNGGKNNGWAYLGNTIRARRWVQDRLANCWNPPVIQNPA